MAAKRTPNPVPRAMRRHSVEWATGEEFSHSDHAKSGSVVKGCWFCHHAPAEHLDHDFLRAGCPDCAADASRIAPGVPKARTFGPKDGYLTRIHGEPER